MNKPKLIDYVEVPKSTTTETHYNYKRYSIALENYIKHLESEVKKLNTPDVSGSLPEFYELQSCEQCYQLTNHLDGICQKCKGNEY